MKSIKLGWKNFKVAGDTYDLLLQVKADQRLGSGDEVIRWMVSEILRLQEEVVKVFPVAEPEVKPEPVMVTPEIPMVTPVVAPVVKPKEVKKHEDVRLNDLMGSLSDIQNEVDKLVKKKASKL